jgi:hypothetical protein
MEENLPTGLHDRIRKNVMEHEVAEARAAERKRFLVETMRVHKRLALNNRVPAVVASVQSRKFRRDANVVLVDRVGPREGKVAYTFEFVADPQQDAMHPKSAEAPSQVSGKGEDQRFKLEAPRRAGLTIAEAKAGLSVYYGVPLEDVKITIMG